MGRALVIGMGNPLRGDDGVGWHVIERLRDTAADERAELLACHQLTPELAGPLAQSEQVIFVDAAEGEPAGEVRLECVADTGGAWQPEAFSHRLDPSALVQYAKAVYGTGPKAVVVSVKGSEYGFSENLSGPVLDAVPRVLSLIEDLLTDGCRLPTAGTEA